MSMADDGASRAASIEQKDEANFTIIQNSMVHDSAPSSSM